MDNYVVLDIETTGINPNFNKIIEIGAVKVCNGEIIDTYNQLINPEVVISKEIEELTGITNEMVKDKPLIEDVLKDFIDFCEEHIIIGHNIIFDYSFIKTNALRLNLRFEKKAVDTYTLAKILLKDIRKKSLTYLCDYFNIIRNNEHRAYDDAVACYELLNILKNDYYELGQKIFEPVDIHWKPKKQQQITLKQKKYLLDLLSKHRVTIKKPIDDLTKSEASKIIDKILFKYGKYAN